MENITFKQEREDLSLICFVPKNFLKVHGSDLLEIEFNEFSIQEKMLLLILDRDGYFYSKVKPTPFFLSVLAKYKIYVQAFTIFNSESKYYGCFLKSFTESNPSFKPTSHIYKNQ